MIAKAINDSDDKFEIIDRLCTEFKKDNRLFDVGLFTDECNKRYREEHQKDIAEFKKSLKVGVYE